MKVDFYPLSYTAKYRLKFVVNFCFHQGKLVMVKHKKRNSWEFPGGHIEEGEDIHTAAKRELIEETAACDFDQKAYAVYSVTHNEEINYGVFFMANIRAFDKLDDNFEIQEVGCFDQLPEDLTYPDIIQQVYQHFKENNLLSPDALNQLP